MFEDVKKRLEAAGLMMHGGSIVDATIISAPSSTKNRERKRDSEMHQTKKGNEWHYGMKIHSGVDAGSGYVHTITATAANVHDVTEAAHLIREDDEVVYGDRGTAVSLNGMKSKTTPVFLQCPPFRNDYERPDKVQNSSSR